MYTRKHVPAKIYMHRRKIRRRLNDVHAQSVYYTKTVETEAILFAEDVHARKVKGILSQINIDLIMSGD